MATYFYSISGDTLNGRVNLDALGQEIRDANFSRDYTGGSTVGDELSLGFVGDLQVAEKTALDAIVAAHTGDALVEPNEAQYSLTSTTLYLTNTDDATVANYKQLSKVNDYNAVDITTTAAALNAAANYTNVQLKRFRLASLGQTILERGVWTLKTTLQADDSSIWGRLKFVVAKRDAGGAETILFRHTNSRNNITPTPLVIVSTFTRKPERLLLTDSLVIRYIFVKEDPTPAGTLTSNLYLQIGGLKHSRVTIPANLL